MPIRLATRPSFPRNYSHRLNADDEVPPPPPPTPPPSSSLPLPFKQPPPVKRPPPTVHVEIGTPSAVHTTKLPADLPHYRNVVHQRLTGLEELQKSMIAQAHRQMAKQPGDIFLQPLDAVLHQLGDIASEMFEARAKATQVDNFVASFQVAKPCPERPPVPTKAASTIDSCPPFKAASTIDSCPPSYRPSKRKDSTETQEGTGSSSSSSSYAPATSTKA